MKNFEREATSSSDSWGTCVPARMILRPVDGDDGVNVDEGKVVVGEVDTREEGRMFMFSSASAISSTASSCASFAEHFVSEVPVSVVVAVVVSVAKHASTSKRTIIFISSISCFPTKKRCELRSILYVCMPW